MADHEQEPTQEEVEQLAQFVDQVFDARGLMPLTSQERIQLRMYELDELAAELRRLQSEGE